MGAAAALLTAVPRGIACTTSPQSPGGGDGGAGVFLNGGTLTTSGAISGGAGAKGGTGKTSNGKAGTAGDAVKFGPVASTLVVEPHAVFNGQVVAENVHDVLELSGTQSGGTAITLGTQFTNFWRLDFAADAQWTAAAKIADLTSHPLTIDGFAVGDALDITNLGHSGATASFHTTTDVLTITKGATMITLQFDRAFSGEHFVLTANGSGTEVSLQSGAAATIADLRHDITTFVGDGHRALMGDRFTLGARAFGAGPMLHMVPGLVASGAHDFSSDAFTDHAVPHASVMLR